MTRDDLEIKSFGERLLNTRRMHATLKTAYDHKTEMGQKMRFFYKFHKVSKKLLTCNLSAKII